MDAVCSHVMLIQQRTAEQAAALGIPLSVLDDHPKVMVTRKARKLKMWSESNQITLFGAEYLNFIFALLLYFGGPIFSIGCWLETNRFLSKGEHFKELD